MLHFFFFKCGNSCMSLGIPCTFLYLFLDPLSHSSAFLVSVYLLFQSASGRFQVSTIMSNSSVVWTSSWLMDTRFLSVRILMTSFWGVQSYTQQDLKLWNDENMPQVEFKSEMDEDICGVCNWQITCGQDVLNHTCPTHIKVLIAQQHTGRICGC